MGNNFVPTVSGNTRVFLIEGRARPDHMPSYQSAMMSSGASQSFGDIERIEAPSATEYGKFDEIGYIRGGADRVTITLTGRYAADLKSDAMRMARAGCAFDVQIDVGACSDPSNWNKFTKKIVIEQAFITSYDQDDLGALSGDDQANVNETVEVSGRAVYEVVPVKWAPRGGDVITVELVDAIVCDIPSCGDCQTESTGCGKFFAITKAAGGSPGTPADIVFSLDGGSNWLAHDIETLASGDPDGVDCIGSYIVVVSEDGQNMHYALLSEFTATGDPDFTAIATGFQTHAATGPRAISTAPSGRVAFIVGSGGFIYKLTDPTAGVTLIDAGVAAPLAVYNDVDALSDDFAVAVGAGGAVAKTENGTTWSFVVGPVGALLDLNCVAVKNKSEWLVGTSDGKLWYTLDGGSTWTEKVFSGSGAGSVKDIAIANDSVIYMTHTTAAAKGRIFRSTNGGYDWVVMPEQDGVLALNDTINALAACKHNQDIVFGVGLADDASDGFIIVGTD